MVVWLVCNFFFTKRNSTHIINQNVFNTRKNHMKETTSSLRIGRLCYGVSNHSLLALYKLCLEVGKIKQQVMNRRNNKTKIRATFLNRTNSLNCSLGITLKK